jgi:hypothetical protein
MRSDLSAAFLAQCGAQGRRPRQLLEFRFATLGTVFASDQALCAAHGLSHEYLPLVENWGTLADVVDVGAVVKGESIESRQLTLTLWNGSTPEIPGGFSSYFNKETPENVRCYLYQWFEGLPESDKALIDIFVIQDPIQYDEKSRLISFDLVSLVLSSRFVTGRTIDATTWPSAPLENIGKGLPEIYGNARNVPGVRLNDMARATLMGSIEANSTMITCWEDLSDFPKSGEIMIATERIRYSARVDNTFMVSTRGYYSEAQAHPSGAEILERLGSHVFALAARPITSISNVKVGGYTPDSSTYTTYPASTPPQVIFTELPTVEVLSRSISTDELTFDSVASGTTALRPAQAYETVEKGQTALISELYRNLVIYRAGAIPHDREIVRAFVEIEHFATGLLDQGDQITVWFGGQSLGVLSKPDPADDINILAEVDIDHGHGHQTGRDTHAHPADDPEVSSSQDAHPHTYSDAQKETVSNIATEDTFGYEFPKFYSTYSHDFTTRIYFPGTCLNGVDGRTWLSSTVSLSVVSNGARVRIKKGTFGGVSTVKTLENNETFTGELAWGCNTNMTIEGLETGTLNGGFTISGPITCTDNYSQAEIDQTSPEQPAVTTQLDTSVVVNDTGSLAKIDDVVAYTENNQPVYVTDTSKTTTPITERFDLTGAVGGDFDRLQGGGLGLYYSGSNDNEAVLIRHCRIVYEYRAMDTLVSDTVTADVYRNVYNPADVISDLLNRARLGAYIDSASFSAARSAYSASGYRIDGALAAGQSIGDALKKILYTVHSRLAWGGGVCRLKRRQKMADDQLVASYAASDMQLKSVAVERTPVTDLINSLTVRYSMDQAGGDAPWRAIATSRNTESIAAVGEYAGVMDFELIESSTMAQAVADFYAENRGYPATLVTWAGYLPLFQLEKEDNISISSDFSGFRAMRGDVIAASRVFASAKNRQINLFEITTRTLKYKLWEVTAGWIVSVQDSASIAMGLDVAQNETVYIFEQVAASWNFDETLYLADDTSIVWFIVLDFAETVTTAEELDIHTQVVLADGIGVLDNPIFYIDCGYGGCGYGIGGYGGMFPWRGIYEELVGLQDDLAVASDNSLASDIDLTDTLIISAGYGSEGYGKTPYGR